MPRTTRASTSTRRLEPRRTPSPPASTIVLRSPAGADSIPHPAPRPDHDMKARRGQDPALVVIDAKTGKHWPCLGRFHSPAQRPPPQHATCSSIPEELPGGTSPYIVAVRTYGRQGQADQGAAAFRSPATTSRTGTGREKRRKPESVLNAFQAGHRAQVTVSVVGTSRARSERPLSERASPSATTLFKTLATRRWRYGKPQGPPRRSRSPGTDFPNARGRPGLLQPVEGTFQCRATSTPRKCATGGISRSTRSLRRNTSGDFTAEFVCNIPLGRGRRPASLQPTLYGHGLFGAIGEARRSPRPQLGTRTSCSSRTDWRSCRR